MCRSPKVGIRSVHSERAVRTHRSANAFARGDPGRDLDHAYAVPSHDLIEDPCELGVPVADQEPKLTGPIPEADQKISGLPGDPCTARVGRKHGIDREEITCQRAGRVSADELAPPAIGTPRCRSQPGALQDPADRRAADPVSEFLQFSSDPLLPPGGILPGPPADRSIRGRPTAGASARARPVSPADSSAAPSATPWPTPTRSPDRHTTTAADPPDDEGRRPHDPAPGSPVPSPHHYEPTEKASRPTLATSSTTCHHRRSRPRSRVMTPFRLSVERTMCGGPSVPMFIPGCP